MPVNRSVVLKLVWNRTEEVDVWIVDGLIVSISDVDEELKTAHPTVGELDAFGTYAVVDYCFHCVGVCYEPLF